MSKLGLFLRYKYPHKQTNTYTDVYKIPTVKAKSKPEIIANIFQSANKNNEILLAELNTRITGLDHRDVKKRRFLYGLNEVLSERREFWLLRLLKIITNPLVLLLIFLIFVSLLTKDYRTVVVIFIMVSLGVALRFFQENEAYNSAESLKSMVKTTCSVIRHGKNHEIDLKKVVPGDIISLSAGDLIPADIRLLESKELFINQSVLTGEALPVEKHAHSQKENVINPLELENICYMGTNVESGQARGVIIATGANTYFGSLAKSIVGLRSRTSFDKGIDRFTWLMIGFMAVMAPAVFLINGLTKGNWVEAFLFGIAIAVGLTPEMLPAIVTINLSKGAITMSKKKVIVKRLSSIQNFGAMNVLCCDKTGTLTQNKIVLINNININGKTDFNILHFAYVNSYFQTGFRNLLDSAIIKHGKKNTLNGVINHYKKIDELPFDFKRRRLSIIVEDHKKERMLICKGALEEILAICSHYELNGKTFSMTAEDIQKIKTMNEKFSRDGFRIIAVAHKKVISGHDYFIHKDEENLVFLGLMTFFDPPKESAARALTELKEHGVTVKILTGDNELVTKKIAQEVNLPVQGILMGSEIEKMDDSTLITDAQSTTIFAKLSPDDKRRVIEALQKSNNVVGFLGDGINDAPGLRVADVGISVDSAVDIAKESADIILLEMSLLVLSDGVIEGRKVFGNIIKYIKMGASSNFGNMFSVIGGSLFLPFLPMRASQILVNNLLYDFSQTAIPTDIVDEEYLKLPRRWVISDIGRFMIFIGPISSIFDYLTYFMMLYVFNCWKNPSLFQTGWFVESLITQTMIVHVIRSRKMPFFQTWASKTLIITTISVVTTGILITFSPFASYFNFIRLPLLYWPLLALMLFAYICLTQIVKSWYIKKFGYN